MYKTSRVKLDNIKVYIWDFTKKIKNQIRELNKEVTEEDKENLKKILLAHYQQKTDKVAVKKQKEQEINEFIESLC